MKFSKKSYRKIYGIEKPYIILDDKKVFIKNKRRIISHSSGNYIRITGPITKKRISKSSY